MIFLKYKQPKAEYVQFQRLVSGVIMFIAVLIEDINFVYAFLVLSVLSLLTTRSYSPTTLIFKFTSIIVGKSIFTTAAQYTHSYVINRLAEVFEDLMRISGGLVVAYLYTISPLAAWIMASFMVISMLISSFFGFCLSALAYMGYKWIIKGSSDE